MIRATAGSIQLDCGVRVEQDERRRHPAPDEKEATTLYSSLRVTTPLPGGPRPGTTYAPHTSSIPTGPHPHPHWTNSPLLSSSYIKLGASCGPSSLPIAREEGGVGDRSACSNPDPDFFPSSAAIICGSVCGITLRNLRFLIPPSPGNY